MYLLWAMMDLSLLRGHVIAQAVICQPLAVEGQVWFWTSSWKFYDGQSDWYGIFSEHFSFLVNVMPPVIRTQPNLHVTFIIRTIRQSPGTIKGVMFLMKAGNTVQKNTSSFFPSGFEEITAMFSFLNCLMFHMGISKTNYSTELFQSSPQFLHVY